MPREKLREGIWLVDYVELAPSYLCIELAMSYGEMKDPGGSCLPKKRPDQQEFCSRSFRSSVKKDGCQTEEMSRRSGVHSRNSTVRLAACSKST